MKASISLQNKFSLLKKCLLVSFFILPTITIAQSTTGKNFKLGFTTSPTFGWLNFSPGNTSIKSDGLRTGFSYGVLGDFGFSNNYFFSSGLTVTTINANTEVIQPTISKSAYKLQYLEVPLTLKLKSNEQTGKLFYGQFGLSTGVKIGAKQTIENHDDADISKEINIFRLGLVIGGGAEWRLGQNLNLLTGVSYNNGFTDVFDTNVKAKNSYTTLNLGVFF